MTIYEYLLLLKVHNFVAKVTRKGGAVKYPKEFVDAVKEEYPEWQELHRALDAGEETVGEYLAQESSRVISPDHVVALIDQGKVEQLKAEAQKLIRGRQLYTSWCGLILVQKARGAKSTTRRGKRARFYRAD